MNSIKSYLNLWPTQTHPTILSIFEGLKLTHDIDQEPLLEAPFNKTIVICQEVQQRTLMRLLGWGYQHVIQEKRDDFSFSLLSTALILKKPHMFYKKPAAFLFKSYTDITQEMNVQTLDIMWTPQHSKQQKLEEIIQFLSQVKKTKSFQLKIYNLLDEMISNALDPRLTNPICRLQIILASDRICFACYDNHTHFPDLMIRDRLKKLSSKSKFEIRETSLGAGLGIPLMMMASSHFYLCHKPQVGSLAVSLIDLRHGLKGLEEQPKNVHIFSAAELK
jgi:hypothetical protein